jgi:hypothetical protein
MPLPVSHGLFVRFRVNIYRLIVVAAVLVTMLGVDTASAQSPFRLPFMAPSRPSLFDGAFYMSGGVKFRNLSTVTFSTLEATDGGAAVFGEARYPFTNKLWTPTIEVGYQESNFFDVFAGFSWYDVANAHTMVVVDSVGAVETQTTNYHMRFEVYELRTGGRSWFPVWGMGRIATSLAVATSVVPYWVDATREFSTVAGVEVGHQYDWAWHFAIIGGVEFELDRGRWFLKTAAEYSYGNQINYESLAGTRTEINPMGFGLVFQGGFRF